MYCNEYRKYGRDDANAGIVTTTVVENFQKHGDQEWRITYIIRSRAGSTNIPAAIPPVLVLPLPVSLSPYFPSIVNPARTRGWIPACPRSQGPPRRNYERDENREREEGPNVFHVRHILVSDRRWHKFVRARNNVNNKGSGL